MLHREVSRIHSTIFSTAAALLALAVASPAQAALQRVGPVSADPQIGGFPTWYQDQSALSLEFCDPLNQSEVSGGWCLLLPPMTLPESFPSNFNIEHFYWNGTSSLSPANGSKATLTLALEASFAPPATVATPGQQIAFARIRVKLTAVPATGTYRFIHPYGEEKISANAGDVIFFTDDTGNLAVGGPFDAALPTRIGPFLLPSATPGGAEMPPVTAANPTPDTNPADFGGAFAPTAYPATGKSYIADPARIGPVTGSPLPQFTDSTGALRDHNIFRIEGPAGSGLGGAGVDFIETTNFTLQGRVFAGTIPGQVTVDRASYTRTASATKLDVFATGSSAQQGRQPAGAAPTAAAPALSFFEAPCGTDITTGALIAPVGFTAQQMFEDGTYFWSQSVPATIPTSVCVEDSSARDVNGNVVPVFYQKQVTDEITITNATYDGDSAVLTVNATSSDAVTPPSLAVDAFGAMTNGALSYSPLMASPAKITVRSSLGGIATIDVKTNFFGAAPGALRALNDSYTFPENSAAQILNVLANDVSAAGGTVAITAAPRLGTAVANADGTVTYTPNLNASGSDTFNYSVTTTAGTATATVSITLTLVAQPPTAVNDGPINVVAGKATQLPNLLANDTDPNGPSQLVAPAAAVHIVAPAGVIVSGGAGGNVTVTVATPGTYTFTYQAQNVAGLISANTATVTLNVIPADTVTITKATFTTASKRWVVTGSTSVPNQTINLTYVNGAAAGHSIGTVAVDALGNWTLDIRNVTGLDDPTTLNPRPVVLKATSSFAGASTVNITYK